MTLPAFHADKRSVIEVVAARFDQFVLLPGFLEGMIQMHSTPFFQTFGASILLNPKVSTEIKIKIVKDSVTTWPNVWNAFAQIIQDPATDKKLISEILFQMREQPIWTKEFWDAMLKLVQSIPGEEVAYDISKAYGDRLIPASHRAAIVQLIKKLPDNGIRNNLRQLQIRNTGVALTAFPEPKGVPYIKGRECQLDLLGEFQEQSNSQPNWLMRQYRRTLQRMYPRWR